MTKCYQNLLPFSSVKRRKAETVFSGSDISSNGGIDLPAQVDQQMGVTQAVARVMGDTSRWKLLHWRDRHNVRYIVGLAEIKRLKHKSPVWIEWVERKREKE